MPLKDLAARKVYARLQYERNREKYLMAEKARKVRLKAAKALLPKPALILKPCIQCGTGRKTDNFPARGNTCKSCVASYQKAYRAANSERISESKKQWAIENADYKAEKDRLYAQQNPDKRTLARKKWSSANPGEDKAAKAKNHAARIKRIPTWLTEDDEWMIAQAYELAALRTKLFGFSWHVDHVIPLNGKKVSGLHVPSNLQVIPWQENLRKGNRMEVA